jgi:pimeloyl-ACP methyl ester carboxylesterase
VLTGQKDRTVSPGNQRMLAERIPGARQISVANGGHALSEDQPDMVFRAGPWTTSLI